MTAPNTPAETSDQLNKPAKSGKLEVSDLITIGVFAALYFVMVCIATLVSTLFTSGFGSIFLPAIMGVGGDLIHFGLLMTVGLAIGMATPPVAIDIYVASAITGLSLEEISRPIIPMVLALILTLLLMTYVPWLVLALPRFIYG